MCEEPQVSPTGVLTTSWTGPTTTVTGELFEDIGVDGGLYKGLDVTTRVGDGWCLLGLVISPLVPLQMLSKHQRQSKCQRKPTG